MKLAQHISEHFKQVFLGGNWTVSSFHQHLEDVTWQEATTKINGFNTIVGLTYHSYYFVKEVLKVLNGEKLDADDKYSFDHPEINNEEDWSMFLKEVYRDVELFAEAVLQFEDSKFDELMANEKYGNYYRNITGIIEHSHYHLGQIVIIKGLIRNS